ncbi:hypothetical protein MRQ86_38085 [Streptomyces sp. MMS21 TC-5]|uniref:hypothetical protein n=1 Tax=Streptomyces sp. MMS21 TC-5 TaxID=2925833 RepID=UPI001F60C510|nr:hypothetical protein [Streptomyces sp. MMS21 TC-5]MCI4086009.1 hypothetical protein [Streptomyces sp. MMS21 TC-5]
MTSAQTRGRPAAAAQSATRRGEHRGVGEQHRVHRRREVPGADGAVGGDPHSVPARARAGAGGGAAEPAARLGERAAGGVRVPPEVEQPEGPGPLGGGHDPRAGLLEGADRDDQVADGG